MLKWTNSKTMKKKYIAPKIEIIKVENDCHLLVASSGNTKYDIGDPSSPSGDGTSGGIASGGDESEWEGQGAKKNYGWGIWGD